MSAELKTGQIILTCPSGLPYMAINAEKNLESHIESGS